jgi:peptide/nickel transport system substrate-binding protein
MRKYYWYISIFFKKHGLVVLGSIIIAIIFFSLSLPFVIKVLDFKQKKYIGVVGRYTISTLPSDIQQEMSSGLTKLQPDGSVIPDIAERWHTEDDGKTYRFLLKKKVLWQDGKELTPTDVNYDFNKVQVITTANEIIFKLSDPFVPFPTAVSQPLLRIADEPYFFFFKKKKVIGTGPFQVSDFQERGQRLSELTLSSDTEQKIYRFYLTEAEAIDGFKRGEVDDIADLASPGELKDWPTVKVQETLDKQTYLGVFFNTASDVFSSNEVRQALNYALHKPTDESRAVGPISPNSWAFSNVGKTYDYDLDRAVDRLTSSNPHQPLHFDLTTTPMFNDEAEQIKKDWETLGNVAADRCQKDAAIKDKAQCDNLYIQVNLRINNFPDTNNFEALLVGQESPSDPDQYALWHSKQQTNFTQYSNVRIDSLLEKGRQTEDVKKRGEIYQEFQQFFSEDAPVIFLRYLNKFEVQRGGR